MNRGEDIFGRVKGWDSERLKQARILVVGAGALGNEVLKNLALLGVGQIGIMDFDQIVPHNLSRSVLYRLADALAGASKVEAAARALREINPDIQLIQIPGDVIAGLGLGLLRKMDVVIGCLDNRLARLYLNRLCWRAGVPWVDGGILQLSGQVCAYVPDDSCYECQLSQAEWHEIRQRLGCADMAQRYAQAGLAVTTPLAASVIGAVQVQEALRLLFQAPSERKGGQMFSYEGAQLSTSTYTRRGLQPDCLSHATWKEIHVLPSLSHETRLKDLLKMLEEELECKDPVVVLPHGVGVALAGMRSKVLHAVVIPKPYLSDALAASYRSEAGEVVGIPKGALWEEAGASFPYLDVPLWRLGIPFGDVLQIKDGKNRLYVEAGGDLLALSFQEREVLVPNPWLTHDVRSSGSVGGDQG